MAHKDVSRPRLLAQLLPLFLLSASLFQPILAGANCAAPIVVTADQLKGLDPKVCADAAACKAAATPFSTDTDCSTAAEAALGISAAFRKYNVVDGSIAAAAISNMLTQSDGFRFNHNRWNQTCRDGCQGTYGAGTKAMLTHPWLINYIMNSNDNALIAASIAINPDWKACKGKLDCTGTPEQLEKNLALVNDTVRTYEPGVWFLSSGHVLDAANCPATMLADVSAGKTATYQKCLGDAMDIAPIFPKVLKAMTCDGAGSFSVPPNLLASIHFEAQPSNQTGSADQPPLSSQLPSGLVPTGVVPTGPVVPTGSGGSSSDSAPTSSSSDCAPLKVSLAVVLLAVACLAMQY